MEFEKHHDHEKTQITHGSECFRRPYNSRPITHPAIILARISSRTLEPETYVQEPSRSTNTFYVSSKSQSAICHKARRIPGKNISSFAVLSLQLARRLTLIIEPVPLTDEADSLGI